jgi:hypothetical protein
VDAVRKEACLSPSNLKITKGDPMQRTGWIVSAVAALFLLSTGVAFATDQERTKEKIKGKADQQEEIYGSQLMTKEEREEYRAKMRSAKTSEEREQIRTEHHEKMKARAEERGMKLPEEPPMKGSGMGSGGGMGPGPGSGGGKP